MYYLTILICMAIISAVDFIVAKPIYGFELWYIIVAVVVSTIAEIIIDSIFATIVRWLMPKKWFNVDKKWFIGKKAECRFYEKIGIKKWKEKVLELGAVTNFRKNKILDPTNNEYVSRYIVEANYGIVVHIACIVFGYLVVFLFPLKYFLCFGVPVAIVNTVLNLLPLFILRYNLPKLHSLYKFNLRRKKVENKKCMDNIE